MFLPNQRRPFIPSQPAHTAGSQALPTSNTHASGAFGAQIKPSFIPNPSPSSQTPSASRMQRTQPDTFNTLSPQGQRAALYDQARQQASSQATYQALRNPASALPAGLTKRQRADFTMLSRTNPLAAQAQLQQYQRTADIRYNKPGSPPPASPGLTHRRPPGGPTGPRRSAL